jgi:hypothetical protein
MATNDAVTKCPQCKSSKIVDYSMSIYECAKCRYEWMVDDVATLRAENARLRAIVEALAESDDNGQFWYGLYQLSQKFGVEYRHDIGLIADLARKAINDGAVL